MVPQKSANQLQQRAGIKNQPGREHQGRQDEHRDSRDAKTPSRAATTCHEPYRRPILVSTRDNTSVSPTLHATSTRIAAYAPAASNVPE